MQMDETNIYHAVALLSGGLDSILAARLVQDQGLRVKCLHFVTPFFGKPHLLRHWEEVYGLDIEAVDISEEYVRLLVDRPVYGFGKVVNPCVDCKILMMRHARACMERYGASFIISGEVVGQRPMSQRRDTLNVIRRDADVRDILLRPLSALSLEPSAAEESGLVDRERLLKISGRGRKEQLALAKEYGFSEIPTPAGGCKLAEKENARRYWPVLTNCVRPGVDDFVLSNIGRQFWAGKEWLVVGRNQADNELLQKVVRDTDLMFKIEGFPGPLAVGRPCSAESWSEDTIYDAAAYIATFSPKARKSGGDVGVRVTCGDKDFVVTVSPSKETALRWSDIAWEPVKAALKAEARERAK